MEQGGGIMLRLSFESTDQRLRVRLRVRVHSQEVKSQSQSVLGTLKTKSQQNIDLAVEHIKV